MRPSVRKLLVAALGFVFICAVLTATGGYFVARRVVQAVKAHLVTKAPPPTAKDLADYYRSIFQSEVPAGMRLESGKQSLQLIPPLDTFELDGVWPGGNFPPWRGKWQRLGTQFESEQGVYHCTLDYDAKTGRFHLLAQEAWN